MLPVTGGSSSERADASEREQISVPAALVKKVGAGSAAATTSLNALATGRGGMSPATILALQRRIGNRNTMAVIRRDLDGAAKAEPAPAPKPDPKPGAKKGWGALKGAVDESTAFNKPGRKQSGPMVMDDEIAAELGPERAEKFKKLMGDREARQKKTTTAGGAYLASQVGLKDKIGSSDAYVTPDEREGHLGEFLEGAHAFVSNEAYLKIQGLHVEEKNFNTWGNGSNFVAPLVAADKLVAEAAEDGGRGLFLLEERLGIPKMSWVNQCKSSEYGIWRFKILKPEVLNLRIPSGGESGAYGTWVDKGEAHRGEWRPGGKTLGGAKEAVIDQVGAGDFGAKGDEAGEATRNKLAELQKDGVIQIVLDASMAENTRRVLAEMGKPEPHV